MMMLTALVLVIVPLFIGLLTVQIAFRLIDKLKEVVGRTV